MARARLRGSCAVLLSSLIAACGGSGGGGGGPAGVLPAGPFHSVSFRGIHGSPDTTTTNVGTVVSDGVDTLTSAGSTQNRNAGVTVEPGGDVFSFSSPAPGVLSLTDAFGTEALRGGVLPGGEIAAVAAVMHRVATEAALEVYVKKGSGLSDATLAGDWHTCYFGAFVAGTHFGIVGTAAFDGIGGATLGARVVNQDGVVDTTPSSGPSTYGVAPDGTFTLGANYQGGVSAAGDFATAGGGVTPGSLNVSWVFVRQAALADAATLTGTYTLVGVGYGLANARYYDFTGDVTADGAGNCTIALASSEEGVVSTVTDIGTYTVAADGTLSLTFVGGAHTVQGAIAPDGRLGILGGGSSAGSDPTLAVLLRR